MMPAPEPFEPLSLKPIVTERLLLRCVEPDDAETTSRLMTPAISQWLAFWPTPFSREMAFAVIADMRAQARQGLVAPYAVALRETQSLIGWVVVSRDPSTPKRASLGYWLGEAHQGLGLGREAVGAALRASFTALDVDIIEAAAQKDNARSFAIMTGCGMRFVEERLIYALARAQHEPCDVYEAVRPVDGV